MGQYSKITSFWSYSDSQASLELPVCCSTTTESVGYFFLSLSSVSAKIFSTPMKIYTIDTPCYYQVPKYLLFSDYKEDK